MGQIPTTLYEVLDTTCTVEHLEQFLKEYKAKGADSLRTSGGKDVLVQQVREGVRDFKIPLEAVVELVRDYEESGNQHIFYFIPNDSASLEFFNKGLSIGRTLLGTRLTDGTLPNYQVKKNDYVWADFRFTKGGGPWTAKFYGHQERIKFQRQESNESSIIRYYERKEKRIVCLVRWNGTELELRVGRVGAGGSVEKQRRKSGKKQSPSEDPSKDDKREIDLRVRRIMEILRPAKLFDKVSAWDLSSACRTMMKETLAERASGVKPADSLLPFTTPRVGFRDSAFGSAEFNSQLDEESLTSNPARTAAITSYLNEKHALCRKLIVLWHPDWAANAWGDKKLRTVVAASQLNEVVIAAGVNPRTVNYVTNQLREYRDGST